jgi:hypothetical protein
MDQLGGFEVAEVFATRGGIVAGLQFPIRREGVSQKLQCLFVTPAQESLGDVEQDRDRSIIDLPR